MSSKCLSCEQICSFAPKLAANAKPTRILLQEILITLPFGLVFFAKLQFSGKNVFIVRKPHKLVQFRGGK